LVQKYIFSLTFFRKSLKRKLARKYNSSAGIPLVEQVSKRPEDSTIDERVQILETLLRDYYLDDYFLKKIKNTKIKYFKLLKKYDVMVKQNNDDVDDRNEENEGSITLSIQE
jgi:hypothetical protein